NVVLVISETALDALMQVVFNQQGALSRQSSCAEGAKQQPHVFTSGDAHSASRHLCATDVDPNAGGRGFHHISWRFIAPHRSDRLVERILLFIIVVHLSARYL